MHPRHRTDIFATNAPRWNITCKHLLLVANQTRLQVCLVKFYCFDHRMRHRYKLLRNPKDKVSKSIHLFLGPLQLNNPEPDHRYTKCLANGKCE